MACALSRAAPLAAQARATLDAGGSVVHYEGFLASGSFFLTPTLRYDTPGAAVAAQGTYLLFESGNSIVQGTAAGAWLPTVSDLVRPELAGSAGVSAYTEAPTAGHLLGRLRLHLARAGRGAWIGGALGRSYLGDTSHASSELGAGGWVAIVNAGVAASATYSRAADTSYVDLTANAYWRLPGLELDGLLGARTLSDGGGEGAFGEISARFRLAGPLELLVSGGRYPSDPVRGTLAGTFASAGFRLTARPGRRGPSAALVDLLRREPRASESVPPAGAPALTVERITATLRTLRVRAPDARAVEIAADFTDWEALPLRPVGRDEWEIVLPVLPGTHHLNLRVDGGPWLVPRGARAERDDYGGLVGVLVVWE